MGNKLVRYKDPTLIVRAHDRIREMEILDDRLEFAAMAAGDLAAEDDAETRRPADGAVRVEQPFFERIEGCALTPDQIVTVMCPPRICARQARW